MFNPRLIPFAVALAALSFAVAGCGGEQNDEAAAEPATEVTLTPELTAAVERYTDYVNGQADELVTRTTKFAAAVKRDDVDGAKRLFAYARAPFEAIEPVAGSFGDLDPRIDARENDAVDEKDWTGFHRIEKALWIDGTTEGLGEVADTLVDDVKELQSQAKTVKLTVNDMAVGATDLLGEVSKGKITGEEDRYSHTDLYDFQANVDGSKRVFVLLKPVLEQNNPQLASQIEQEFDDVYAALGDYKQGDGYVPYTDLTEADTKKLSQSIDALAEPLSQLAANLES